MQTPYQFSLTHVHLVDKEAASHPTLVVQYVTLISPSN